MTVDEVDRSWQSPEVTLHISWTCVLSVGRREAGRGALLDDVTWAADRRCRRRPDPSVFKSLKARPLRHFQRGWHVHAFRSLFPLGGAFSVALAQLPWHRCDRTLIRGERFFVAFSRVLCAFALSLLQLKPGFISHPTCRIENLQKGHETTSTDAWRRWRTLLRAVDPPALIPPCC